MIKPDNYGISVAGLSGWVSVAGLCGCVGGAITVQHKVVILILSALYSYLSLFECAAVD